MSARLLSSYLLVGAAIFVLFSHICAGPFHVHAGAMTTHAADHSEAGDQGAHGGSCEALRTGPTFEAPALPTIGIALDFVSDVPNGTALRNGALSPTVSPPLFLLHASLLI